MNTMNTYYETIELDISNICNLHCPLCNREDKSLYNKEPKFMDIGDIKNIVEKFPNIKQFNIGFLLCEPTLNENLIEIIKYLKSEQKQINLSTNGQSKFSYSYWINLLSYLDSNDKITWSFDGFSEATYTKYRIGGKLKKLKKALVTAAMAKRNIINIPPPEFIVRIIKFEHNKEEIENNFDSFKKLHHEIFGKPYWSIIESNGKCTINNDSIEPAWDLKKWKELKNSNIISNEINCICKEEKIIFVDYLGRIGFCLPQLTDSIKHSKPVTIYDSVDDINNYIRLCYENRFNNKICQFNCGNRIRKIKEENHLSNEYT